MRPALTNALTNAIREALNYSSTNLDSEPIANYVARLNGTDQYWQLSEDIVIPASTPFKIKVQAELDGNNTKHVLSNYKASDFRLLSVLQFSSMQLFVGSNEGFYSGLNALEEVSTVEIIGDGSGYTISVDGVSVRASLQAGQITFNSIAGKWGVSTGAALGLGVHKNLSVEIDGVLTHSIPLTNKAQGATQLATVGSINATMVNYDESVWEQV